MGEIDNLNIVCLFVCCSFVCLHVSIKKLKKSRKTEHKKGKLGAVRLELLKNVSFVVLMLLLRNFVSVKLGSTVVWVII